MYHAADIGRKYGRHRKRAPYVKKSYNISRPWFEIPVLGKITPYLSMPRHVLKRNKESMKGLQAQFTKANRKDDKSKGHSG